MKMFRSRTLLPQDLAIPVLVLPPVLGWAPDKGVVDRSVGTVVEVVARVIIVSNINNIRIKVGIRARIRRPCSRAMRLRMPRLDRRMLGSQGRIIAGERRLGEADIGIILTDGVEEKGSKDGSEGALKKGDDGGLYG
jgi:hypothetical protein